jgi:CTP:molybdopterin cytidylyltransferase MocA
VSGVGVVVLAAGAATRFGAPKQRLLLPAVLERVEQSPVDEIVVVAGAYDLRDTVSRANVRLVRCPEWERGPGASLRCGLATLGEAVVAAVVVLADGPRLAPGAIERVIESWRAEDGDIVAASYEGIRGHPLLVARSAWDAIPDGGLRVVDPRLVPCDDLGAPGDVDTPGDLAALGEAGDR